MIDEGSEFYNSSFKIWLEDNDKKMYSSYNEGTSVAAERFIRTLKNKIYKHLTVVSKNVYVDVLDNIVGEYNNAHHRTIKMKPIDVKSNYFAECNVDSNEKVLGDRVSISEYKNIFAKAKAYTPN